MSKSKFLKLFLIILAILMISGVGYAAWRVSKTSKEKEICNSSDDNLKCEVKKLLHYVDDPDVVLLDGRVVHMDIARVVDLETGEDITAYAQAVEQKLIESSEIVVPILIEIFKTDKKYEDEIIYILKEIGNKEAIMFLESISNSKSETCLTKSKAAHALGRATINCSK